MKQFKDYINESKKFIKSPEIDTIAYDYNGEEWIIKASCYADGGAPEGCNSLKELLKQYDFSGAIADDINNLNELPNGKDTIIVGACMKNDEEECAAWIWGPEGICYENE